MNKKDLHDAIEGFSLLLILAKQLETLHAQRAEFEEAFYELTSTAGVSARAIRVMMDKKSERWLESDSARTHEELACELENLEAAELPEIPEIHI